MTTSRHCVLLLFLANVAMGQAMFYFDHNLKEIQGNYDSLHIIKARGKFVKDVVPAFGQNPRWVYEFPQNSGLVYLNSGKGNFINGSYTLEMLFKYDQGDLLPFGKALNDKMLARKGQYIHFVTSRDAQTKKVVVYINGSLQMEFDDPDNQLHVDKSANLLFFNNEDEETSSGKVAMIKIYDKYVDPSTADDLFQVYNDQVKSEKDLTNGKINNLFFVQSKAQILPESQPELENLARFLQNKPTLSIKLEGHTDNQGDRAANVQLSIDRAKAVKSYLVSNGIAAKRITSQGFGPDRPISSNATEASRRKNRRVELVIE